MTALADVLIVDSVAHGFDCRADNAKAGRFAEQALESFFLLQHSTMPDTHRLSKERYYQPFTADAIASALFVESPTTVGVYHTIPAWGIFEDLSPIAVGMDVRERHPGRMFLYGAVSPLEGPAALEQLEQQVSTWGIDGLKLYPVDIIDGKLRRLDLGDEQLVYPLLERCRELGVDTIAIHKAIPLSTSPMAPFRVDDVDHAAADFPDLNFEIVHGGFAFLEETARQLRRFPNVYVNLESTAQLALNRPDLFAHVIGELLYWGGHERILWATGCCATHPDPVLRAFWDFEMPEQLREGYGYPALDEPAKRAILGENAARLHGWDPETLRAAVEGDELARVRESGDWSPWGRLP